MMARFLLLFAFIAVSALSGGRARAAAPPPAEKTAENAYSITVIPFYGPEKIWTLYAPFVDYLKKATGKPWELKLYPSHDALIAGLCNGQVAFALLGPVPMGRAMEQCRADIVLTALGKDGKPFYHSVLLTGDPAIGALANLRGNRFALFKGSTAAHILPRKMLREAGLGKDDIVPVFYESQDHIINALLSREVSGAGVKDTLHRKFLDTPLKVLKTSEPLPNFTFAASPATQAETRKLFAETLLVLQPNSNTEDHDLMSLWDEEIRNGFIPPPNGFRESILDLLTVTKDIMREDR